MGPKNAIFDEKGEVLFLDFFLRRIFFLAYTIKNWRPARYAVVSPNSSNPALQLGIFSRKQDIWPQTLKIGYQQHV